MGWKYFSSSGFRNGDHCRDLFGLQSQAPVHSQIRCMSQRAQMQVQLLSQMHIPLEEPEGDPSGEPPDEGPNSPDSSPLEVSPTDLQEEEDATLSDDEAEDEASEDELVSRPPLQPSFATGKIKVMQRQQADGEEIVKSSGDESEVASKIDPSRLPLEQRERYYMEARARIFGEGAKVPEAEVANLEEAAAPEDPQTVQRRVALEMKLAQERINDLKDPAYSRAIYPRFGYAMKGKGKGQLQGFIAGFQAAPTDYRGAMADPSQAPLAARAAVLEGQVGP
ncbi:unnamed protein product [Durusdinium trenchii]|uniref:SUZ domain-containing protein n=1 Tax=Durusdinium trenchii TaxID=1381693 RepID=A0ABP0JY06_9DINO